MSLILDALRKLDRQKSLSRKGTVDLAVSILSPDASPPRKKWRFYLVTLSLTAVVAASITYLAVVGFGSRGKSSSLPFAKFPPSSEQIASATPEPEPFLKISPPSPEKPSLASREVAPAAQEPGTVAKSPPSLITAPRASQPRPDPVSSAALPPEKTLTGDSAASPGSSQRAAISSSESGSPPGSSPPASEVPIKISPPPPPAPLPRETADQIRSGKTQQTPQIETQPGSKAPPPASSEKMTDRKAIPEKVDRSPAIPQKSAGSGLSGPPSSPPQLKISGIVWHDEPFKRRAVINGVFTSEGSTIEGVEVVEILPTRVRFLYQGRPFEISIFE